MAEKDYKDDPIEKKHYSKWMFLIGSLFLLVSLLAMLDEGIWRRSWKPYQNEFNQLELAQVTEEYEALAASKETSNLEKEKASAGLTVEQLPDEPDQLSLKQMRLKLEEAEIARETPEYKQLTKELKERQIALDDKVQERGFAKADQDEIYYLWKHALHEGHDYQELQKQYWELEERITELGDEVAAAEGRVDEVRQQLAKYDDRVAKWRKAIETYYAPLEAAQRKIDNVASRTDAIEQVVIPDLGIVEDVTWGKVDRCMTCHTAVDRSGFEDYPAPFQTHPFRDEITKAHPVSEFGCTTCHWGQGRATQIKHEPLEEGDFAHGFEHHWTKPLLRGDFVQSSCYKCHADQWKLDHAPVATEGKRLFMEVGCIGCHNIKGFEEFPKAGPSLEKVGAKVRPEWIVDWIENPRGYDPHTRMPKAPLAEGDALRIASYLKQASGEYELPYGAYPGNGNAERGQELFSSVGCYACHMLDGKGNSFAPTLDRIMEKTNPDWIYNWIQNPKSYHGGARMPSLRLSAEEAADITAYLATKGVPAVPNQTLRDELADPESKEKGYLLITQYGCYGCHNIKGTEQLSKLSVDLSTYGKKTVDKLDFGDTDIPETWEDWTFNKIKQPDIYVHERSSNRMPRFPLKDEEIHSLVVFLKGLRGYTPPEKYVPSLLSERQRKIDKGRRLTRRLNCIGCHVIEGEGGSIVSLYEDPSSAPPNLAGEGAKIQPPWLFDYLKNPGQLKIRPWLNVRMPTFKFTDEQAQALIEYFSSLDEQESLFVTLPDHPSSPEMLENGELLASGQYFSCFSCHVQGDKFPTGPKSMWAPDLGMVAQRIRPEFLPKWIQNPAQFTPGVRMPAFLPEPGTGPPNILDGDRDKQAQAIADYILKLSKEQQSKRQYIE